MSGALTAAAAPYIAAAGAAYGAISAAKTSQTNALVARNEANLSTNQAGAQEGMELRAGRQQLGKQIAAFGAAGVGFGGSSETALDQSAINDELNALNAKYRGSINAYGYNVQSQNFQSQGNQQSLLAGAALLKGVGSNYSAGGMQLPQPSVMQNNPQLLPGDSG
jgi:hypothetical protein